jgi:hypothetical protein
MKTIRHEKTQRGNPHSLTIDQHVFPAKSIGRFIDTAGRVDLVDKIRGRRRKARQNDPIFCAQRAWNQRVESGYMKDMEDEFQELADQIIAGTVVEIDAEQKETVNRFFALWYMRSRYRRLDSQETQTNGVTGSDLTKDQEEILEKNGYMFTRLGGGMPTRQLHGVQLQMRISQYANNDIAGTPWGVIQAQQGEFVVPDVPTLAIVPLIPTACLAANCPTGTILIENLAEINRALIDESYEYFFARDLGKCPVSRVPQQASPSLPARGIND